jgi:large repetitive protein
VTTCFVTDQKVYTINVSPSFAITGTNPIGCGTATGTITLQLSASAPVGGPYSYFLSGPGFNQQAIDQTVPSTIGPLGGKSAGTYSVIVQDQISGCTLSSSVGLTDAVFTATAAALAPNCDPVTVRVTSTAVNFPLQYTVTNNGTGALSASGSSASAAFNITPGLAAGTYTIQLNDASAPAPGCIFVINNFTVAPNAPVSVTLTPDLCAVQPAITATGASSYSWSTNVPGSIVGATNGATIQLLPGAGTVTYTVIANAAGSCPATQSITVDVPGTIVPAFTQTDACAEEVILTASPSGNFTYRWFKTGVFQPALLGQQIVLGISENGSSYQVQIVNTLTGCTVLSPAQTVTVTGTITASVTATPACDDNKPFTLTATTNATGVTYAWFFNSSALSTATTATTDQIEAGTYRVDVKKNTCLAQAEIQIIKAPLPVGGLPDRVIICNDPDNVDPSTSSVDLDPGDFTAYNWFKNQLTLNYTTRVLNADSEGLYEVDITNSFGCIARDKTEVNNECLPKIEAPNAFRPSSSIATNKEFFVFTYFITDNFQIFIYNRWGELVFESTDRNFKWNGGYKNNGSQPAPVGMYAYIIKYESAFRPDKGIQEKRGGVSLIR